MGGVCSQEAESQGCNFTIMGAQNSKVQEQDVAITATMSEEKIDQLFRSLDANKSQKLDFTEFASVWTLAGLKPNNRQIKVQVFERYDVNKDGAIDMKEFKSFVNSLGKDSKKVDAGYEWGYEKHNGPTTWCAHFDAANGKEQSPIDVDLSTVKSGKDYPKVSCHYKNCKAVCVNNSHTVCWSVEDAGHIMIGDKKFKLAQFHYHCPSEHYINGSQHPLCLHFVHVADDGTLAVIGRIFKFGKVSDKFMDAVTANKPLNAHESCTIDEVPFELVNHEGDYAHYKGSLTTPPCSEKVEWYVKQSVDVMSHAQENWFRSCLCFDNARPLQGLNNRSLVCVPVTQS